MANKKKKQSKKKDTKLDILFNYGISSSIFLFVFITLIIVLTSIVFICGGKIFRTLLIIIYLLTILLYLFFNKKKNIKENIITILIGTLVFIFTVIISSHIYDSTADGNTYHKLAVGAMKNGWNPVWQDVQTFNTDKGNPFDIYKDNVNTKWVNTYAKGSEIYGAVVYSLTNNIEAGKSFNMLFVFIMFFIMYFILRELKLKEWQAIIISLPLALNPISMTQLTNYYLDGVLSICLFIIIITIMNKELLKNNINYLILGMAIIWCCSVKFTGLAFAAIFCFLFYIYNNYKNIKEEKKLLNKPLIKDTIFYVIVVLISVVIVGSSSYTKNFVEHQHPFYPLYGKGHVENMVLMEMPLSMQEDSKTMIFLKGIFCKSENSSPRYASVHDEPDWKIPFTISREELTNFVSPDLRIGGFGYFFGGVFILALLGTLYYLFMFIKRKDYDELIKNFIVLITIFTLVYALDGSYWARYIPYVYIIPILVMINFYKLNINIFTKIYPILITLFLILDSVLILGIQLYSTKQINDYYNMNILAFKNHIKNNKNINIRLSHHGVQGVQYNLDDLGINNYTLVDDEKLNKEGYNFFY